MMTIKKCEQLVPIRKSLDRLNARCVTCMARKSVSVFNCNDECRETTAVNRRTLENRIKEVKAS